MLQRGDKVEIAKWFDRTDVGRQRDPFASEHVSRTRMHGPDHRFCGGAECPDDRAQSDENALLGALVEL